MKITTKVMEGPVIVGSFPAGSLIVGAAVGQRRGQIADAHGNVPVQNVVILYVLLTRSQMNVPCTVMAVPPNVELPLPPDADVKYVGSVTMAGQLLHIITTDSEPTAEVQAHDPVRPDDRP